MKWTAMKHQVVGACHIATVGNSEFELHAYISNNGGGWFNWCISPSDDDFMMEHPKRIEGGSKSLKAAKAAIEKAVRDLTAAMAEQVDLIDPADYRDAKDARLVLGAMGYDRQQCKKCKRRTVVPGFICWNCSTDNSGNYP